jgi:aryl-alcohol dehydrogenase-like predicted oxidoreductase
VVAQLEESLRRLRTDHVDLYWMHAWDRLTPIDETLRALDDLVRAGKVRYVGFSNTPAWKVAQAQVLASLRGWTSLAALQVEYSLLERTSEGELAPAALELGLGVFPWSPLKNGVLSGKYTRANRSAQNPTRGALALPALTDERTYDTVERVADIAGQLGVPPAAIALAWLREQPQVSSTIIGVSSLEQLEANLSALDVRLDASQLRALDDATRPQLDFPAELLTFVGRAAYAGTTINGKLYPATPFAPQSDAERA